MLPILIDIALGVVIGLTLGLLGGGGSILTVPALVYIVGQSPQAAVTASLIIVGMNSMMGTFFHRAQGTLNWKVALVFGGAGMFTAYLAAGLSKLFPGAVLLLLFALLMLVVGTFMLLRKSPTDEVRAMRSWPIVVASGAGVGLLTGLLGVGGGFLIVPAIMLGSGMATINAVGSSLVSVGAFGLTTAAWTSAAPPGAGTRARRHPGRATRLPWPAGRPRAGRTQSGSC